jgi:hypothetical protein
MRAKLHGITDQAEARRALEEIERLLGDAARSGVALDPWMSELADELRAVLPAMDAEGAARIAKRVAANPRASLAAQGRMRAEMVRALKP